MSAVSCESAAVILILSSLSMPPTETATCCASLCCHLFSRRSATFLPLFGHEKSTKSQVDPRVSNKSVKLTASACHRRDVICFTGKGELVKGSKSEKDRILRCVHSFCLVPAEKACKDVAGIDNGPRPRGHRACYSIPHLHARACLRSLTSPCRHA